MFIKPNAIYSLQTPQATVRFRSTCAQIADLIGLERTSEQGGRGEREGLKGFGASFKISKKRGVSFNIREKSVENPESEAYQMMTDEEVGGARDMVLLSLNECMNSTTDISKQSKDRLRDPVLQVTMRDHATYPSTFLTYLYRATRQDVAQQEMEGN